MTQPIDPAFIAVGDQINARVREHVTQALQHWRAGTCEYGPEACVGADLLDEVAAECDTNPRRVGALYLEAIALLGVLLINEEFKKQQEATDEETTQG